MGQTTVVLPTRTGQEHGQVGAPAVCPPDDDLLTAAYQGYLAVHAQVPGGPLLHQTAAIASLRRAFADHVALAPGAHVVDLGCGFGPVAFELAHRARVHVTGIDHDAEVLEVARRIGGALGSWLCAGSTVAFTDADLYGLPVEAGAADAVTASLVFQHLDDPAAAVAEARRVLRPSGRVFIFDVDDGLGASYPESDDLAFLERVFARWQRGYGGDREIGRKLPVVLAEGGFRVTAVSILPSAALVLTAPDTPQRTLTLARLGSAAPAMVDAGLVTLDECEAALEGFRHEPAHVVSRIEARVVVVGTRL